jgi:hypothetical protein
MRTHLLIPKECIRRVALTYHEASKENEKMELPGNCSCWIRDQHIIYRGEICTSHKIINSQPSFLQKHSTKTNYYPSCAPATKASPWEFLTSDSPSLTLILPLLFSKPSDTPRLAASSPTLPIFFLTETSCSLSGRQTKAPTLSIDARTSVSTTWQSESRPCRLFKLPLKRLPRSKESRSSLPPRS